MEELLKPGALEKFATITSLFKEFSKVQEARLAGLGSGDDFPKIEEDKYQKLREDLTAEVESVQFHGAKIEYLVDQLYAYNRRLTRSEEHTTELQSLMRISYAFFFLK